MSNQDRGLAVINAAKRGDEATITTLLAKSSIHAQDRGEAVLAAVVRRHESIVVALLEDGPISDQDRSEAIKSAIASKLSTTVTALLANGKISDQYRGEALITAIILERESIVATLLEDGPILPQHRKEALKNAIPRGLSTTVTALLANGPISMKGRGKAVNLAATCQSPTIITALLADGPISDPDRREAIFFAAQFNLTQILKVFEKYRFCEKRCNVIETAIQAKDTTVASDLFTATPLMSRQILRLLTTAMHSKNLESIEVILQSDHYIRPHDFGTALARAAASEDADVIRQIFHVAIKSRRFYKVPFFQQMLITFPVETVVQLAARSLYKPR